MKIATTAVAMVLVIAIMCIGIYAATNISVGSSSNITFTAVDVYATVTVDSQKDADYERTFTANDNQGDTATDTLNFKDFAFDNQTKSYTVNVTVKNDFDLGTSNDITAVITAKAMKDGQEYTAGVTVSVDKANAVITADDTATFVITIALNTNDEDTMKNGLTGVTFNFGLEIAKA